MSNFSKQLGAQLVKEAGIGSLIGAGLRGVGRYIPKALKWGLPSAVLGGTGMALNSVIHDKAPGVARMPLPSWNNMPARVDEANKYDLSAPPRIVPIPKPGTNMSAADAAAFADSKPTIFPGNVLLPPPLNTNLNDEFGWARDAEIIRKKYNDQDNQIKQWMKNPEFLKKTGPRVAPGSGFMQS